jgi:hypothetical protein
MRKFAFGFLAAACALIASPVVHAQAINVTGGYNCQGLCAAPPGSCARAYADGLWPVNRHVSFYNDAGIWSDGLYTGPNTVAATTWGLRGVAFPNQIVWFRPGLRRPVARWIRNPACPF